MALFVLTCLDKPDALPLRLANRGAHFAYIGGLAGVLRLGGPFLDDKGDMAGSLMIIEVEDLAAAKAFSAGDPYVKAGLFQSVDIRPWRHTAGKFA
ncbi:MAG TPA: YciI family protein [Caulobacteraceae bacterium]|nr:YciI family protein [Caulobacteraceae bacterium]